MGRKKIIKYDLVLSYANEDQDIALQLNHALRRKRLDVYCYQKVNQYGGDLGEITSKVYYSGASYAVAIVSKYYKRNYWTNKEWRILLKAKKAKRINTIFLVRIDKSRLSGITGNEVYEEWRENPREIASKIKQSMFPEFSTYNLKIGLIIFAIILLLILVYFLRQMF